MPIQDPLTIYESRSTFGTYQATLRAMDMQRLYTRGSPPRVWRPSCPMKHTDKKKKVNGFVGKVEPRLLVTMLEHAWPSCTAGMRQPNRRWRATLIDGQGHPLRLAILFTNHLKGLLGRVSKKRLQLALCIVLVSFIMI